MLLDFQEPLNLVIDYMYRTVLHTESAEFIQDDSELISLFIQLEVIRNRNHSLYTTHTISHSSLPGPLAQGNDEIDQLLTGSMLEASEFHKNTMLTAKV